MNVPPPTMPGPRRAGRIGILAGLFSLYVAMSVPLPFVSAAGPPANGRPVYVTNADTLDISTFVADVTTGRPALVGGRAKAGDGVRQLSCTPDARHAYVGNTGADTISAYSIGPRGVLIPLPGGADTISSEGGGRNATPVGTVISPNGRTFYVAHVFDSSDGGTIAAF